MHQPQQIEQIYLCKAQETNDPANAAQDLEALIMPRCVCLQSKKGFGACTGKCLENEEVTAPERSHKVVMSPSFLPLKEKQSGYRTSYGGDA